MIPHPQKLHAQDARLFILSFFTIPPNHKATHNILEKWLESVLIAPSEHRSLSVMDIANLRKDARAPMMPHRDSLRSRDLQ